MTELFTLYMLDIRIYSLRFRDCATLRILLTLKLKLYSSLSTKIAPLYCLWPLDLISITYLNIQNLLCNYVANCPYIIHPANPLVPLTLVIVELQSWTLALAHLTHGQQQTTETSGVLESMKTNKELVTVCHSHQQRNY